MPAQPAQPVPAEPVGRQHDLQSARRPPAARRSTARRGRARAPRGRSPTTCSAGAASGPRSAEPLARPVRGPRCGDGPPGTGSMPSASSRSSLRVAHPHLLRQAGPHLGERRGDRVGVRSGFRHDGDRRACRRRLLDAVALHRAAGSARSRKPSAIAAAMPMRGRSRARAKQRKRGSQVGLVLGVGAVERLELPPARPEEQQPRARAAARGRRRSARPRSKTARNMAKFSEIRSTPSAARRCDELGHHELDEPVVGVPVAAHQVEREPVAAPGHEGQQRAQRALAVERLDQHAVAVGRVAEAAQRHGEAALGLGVAPGVGPLDDLAHLVGRQLAVAADA